MFYPIVFGNTKVKGKVKESLGICMLSKNGFRVQINKKKYSKLNKQQKFVTLLHEVIHCSFGLFGHDTRHSEEDGCPMSVMDTDVFSKKQIRKCWNKKRHYYLQDVRNKINNNSKVFEIWYNATYKKGEK